jgi:hypothetical protein
MEVRMMWVGETETNLDRQSVRTLSKARVGSARVSNSGVWSAIAAVFIAAGLLFAGAVSADDSPLVLSDEHVGMTAEGIAAEEAAVEAEKIELARAADPDEENEWVDSSQVSEDAAATVCPEVVVDDGGGMGFEACVEAAIRGGNGFAQSSSVCRAVFPEEEAAEAEPAE